MSLYHTIRLSLIFNTGLGMTLTESQYCIPPNPLTTDDDNTVWQEIFVGPNFRENPIFLLQKKFSRF